MLRVAVLACLAAYCAAAPTESPTFMPSSTPDIVEDDANETCIIFDVWQGYRNATEEEMAELNNCQSNSTNGDGGADANPEDDDFRPEWWPRTTWSQRGRAWAGDGVAYVEPMTEELRKAAVDIHNQYRNETGWDMPMLEYDLELEFEAQRYANMCLYEHHRPNRNGENIFLTWHLDYTTPMAEVLKAAKFWHHEWKYVDTNGWYCMNHRNALAPCGHLSQILWEDTRKVGCAFVRDCGIWVEGQKWNLGYCEYWPAGNHMNGYDEETQQWVPIPPYNRTEEEKAILAVRMPYVEDKFDRLDKAFAENDTLEFHEYLDDIDDHDF